jgi:2-polyprenyl-3-methyl-5-hydroxy-6-metoxy-1,4-benzoquinol methylase
MNPELNYIEINRSAWNHKTEIHIASDFYDHANFMKGTSSLKSIELDLLGDLRGKSILHLQCHFGQDSISLQRMGAQVTAVDFSDKAIESARKFAEETQADVRFICCDIYDLPQHLNETFDIVFTSYGAIGWLPDLNRWASIVSHFLKSQGSFIFVEFHPVVWMFDDDFTEVRYAYMNNGPIH